jgi:hypothetical protein
MVRLPELQTVGEEQSQIKLLINNQQEKVGAAAHPPQCAWRGEGL